MLITDHPTPEPPAISNIQELYQYISLFSPIFNTLNHSVFFVKNTAAEYLYANQTLIRRLGLDSLECLLGKTAETLFTSPWGKHYTQQDKTVLNRQMPMTNLLELHHYPSGNLGWCITHKFPIRDTYNCVIAVMGISIDVLPDADNRPELNQKLAKIEAHIRQHFHENITMRHLEKLTGLSTAQIERSFKKVFQLTPVQYLQKIRIDAAIALLAENLTITEIAARCGYADHSAFSRQFKSVIGMSPSAFKKYQAA